eukprot:TRINITY_DN7411_c0_g1_i3.p1 TRINITY_DN7411_c0_g1~~TRINITY_DN7411_c0_g1_i3.p1  ORF type:complete len:332 (-),score=48.05 TRINITY_DN7411_c0_g1_i3:234-1229(-)
MRLKELVEFMSLCCMQCVATFVNEADGSCLMNPEKWTLVLSQNQKTCFVADSNFIRAFHLGKLGHHGRLEVQWRDSTTRCVPSLVILDDSSLAIACFARIEVWREEMKVREISTGEHQIHCLAAGREEGHLLTGGLDNKIKEWGENGECLMTLEGHSDFVVALVFDRDGSLWSGSSDGAVKRWANGKCITTLDINFPVRCLAIGCDRVLWVGGVGPLQSWKDGKRVHLLQWERRRSVHALALAENGMLWTSTSRWFGDPEISGWYDGSCRMTLEGHSWPVVSFALARDGTLWSMDALGTIKVWQGDIWTPQEYGANYENSRKKNEPLISRH